MKSVTLKANMARLPRTSAKPLGAKQGSHIISFTADCLNLPAPSAPHQASCTTAFLAVKLKVGALRVGKKQPLTDVPSSPYAQLNVNKTVKAPPFHGSLRGGLGRELLCPLGHPGSSLQMVPVLRELEAGDPAAAPTAGNTQPHFSFLHICSCKKPGHPHPQHSTQSFWLSSP